MKQDTEKKKIASTEREASRPDIRTVCPALKATIPFTSARKWILYASLPSPEYIRLLRIHPGRPGDMIHCSLSVAKLDDALPPYEALSYAWGKEGKNTIICNGWEISDIAPNLFSALDRLRETGKSRLLWVDALCIQQNMKHEKNQQVRHMQYIYKRAAQVVVWLGKDEYDEARFAFAIICSLVNENSQFEVSEAVTFTSMDETHRIPDFKATVSLESEYWTTVRALFSKTWFVRMWVIQEIVLAHSATLIWGPYSMAWDVLGRAIDVIRSKPHLQNFLATRSMQNAYFMNQMRRLQVTEYKATYSFLHLLDWARSFDVTNPNDKVYGLLGFRTRDLDAETGEGKVFIQPDYGLKPKEIYTNVARKILSQEQNLDILSFTTHTFDSENEAKKADWHRRVKKEIKRQCGWKKEKRPPKPPPTWVPNWNNKTVIYPLAGVGPDTQYRCGTFRELRLLPLSKPSILHLKGVIVDTITDTLPSVEFTDLHRSDPHLKRLIDWCASQRSYSSRSNLSTICRVLTANRDRNGLLLRSEPNPPPQHPSQDHAQHRSNNQLQEDFLVYLHYLDHDLGKRATDQSPGIQSPKDEDPIDRAREVLWRYTCYRSPFVTVRGRLGLGPGVAKKGDKVVVLWGSQVPFVLRRRADGGKGKGIGKEMMKKVGGARRNFGRWRFVGECYLEGIMEGEVEGLMGEGERELREEGFEIM